MKHLLKIIVFFSIYCNGQAVKDTLTTEEKDSVVDVKSSWYGRSMFTALTTGSDAKGETLSQRITRNVEFGRSFGSVDVGLAFGEFKHMVVDSSSIKYTELRVSMDACQFGIFSNEISIGAGYMFNSKTPVMMEISSTLYAQVTDKFGFGFVFGDMPPTEGQPELPEDEKNRIMHVSLPIGDTILMGSDSNSHAGMVTMGENVSISINAESRAEADRLFNGLSVDGVVKMPMQDTFWGAYFGMFVDQFGVHWMINFDEAPQK